MTRYALLAASLAFLAFDADAQLFKCVLDGKTIYQQERCPEKAKETSMRAPEAPAPAVEAQKASDEKQAQQTDADLDRLSEVIAGYNVCSEIQKDFREQYAETYNQWGTKNREAFQKYEANPESAARLKASTSAARARITGTGVEGDAKKAALCARVIGIIQG